MKSEMNQRKKLKLPKKRKYFEKRPVYRSQGKKTFCSYDKNYVRRVLESRKDFYQTLNFKNKKKRNNEYFGNLGSRRPSQNYRNSVMNKKSKAGSLFRIKANR